MSMITIQDLEVNKTLDRQAMAQLSGGYTYIGTSSVSGDWSYINQWTENSGFRQIGLIKYKVDKLHKRYQRTQYRTDHYEQLTVVIG